MDLVAYSTQLLDEQRQYQEQLTEIVRGTEQVRTAKAAGKLIRLPAGDGMALVFFDSPEAPVRCAIEISEKLKEYPQLKLRMGIHSGPIDEVRDVNDQTNVAGAGINLARRVMDWGDGGHILLSKRVAEDLSQSRQWGHFLHDLGECAGKHGVPIFLVNFYGGGIGNPELPKTIQQGRLEQAAKAAATRAQRTFRRVYLAVAVVVLSLAIIGLGLWLNSRRNNASFEPEEKSIAVLPFDNFSPAKDNAFFADGIQDDILTSLAKIKDLRVTSRSSVMAFRDTAAQNFRKIGRKLGVAHILEGSVRKEGDRVVVNVQLIDTRNNRQVWADRYDRTLVDSLGLQGELASKIADKLRATISDDEKAQAAANPTQNAEAYVFYLRASQISRNPDTLLEHYKTAEELYMQAIELDPNFALAHARLASVCAEVYRYYEPTEGWRKKARIEAETALQLQPNLAEAHFALGQCLYWMDHDYDGALEQFEIASRLSPSSADTQRLIAAIERRKGKWQEALAAYEQVAKLDPQNPSTARELMYTNSSMRRWPEAARWAEQMRTLAPTSLVAKIQSGYIDFQWKGDTRLLKSILEEIPVGVDPDGSVTAARWDVAMLQRDFPAAQKVLETSSAIETSYSIAGLTPKLFLKGCTYLAEGDSASAQKAFEEARPAFERAVREAPLSAERHASLGWLYALMGRKDDAIKEGQRAVELKPESKDAVDGSLLGGYLALIYVRVGENDLAIPLIEHLLTTPGAVDSADYSITVNDLKNRWQWDPIRDDPRFKELIEKTNP
jgi:TolB-like protein/Tfp pilus assembly protein PilF